MARWRIYEYPVSDTQAGHALRDTTLTLDYRARVGRHIVVGTRSDAGANERIYWRVFGTTDRAVGTGARPEWRTPHTRRLLGCNPCGRHDKVRSVDGSRLGMWLTVRCRALRCFQGKSGTVGKLFAKHIKLKEAIEYTSKTK